MRVTWNKDRKILVDESEMSDKASGDRNPPDQETQEPSLTRNAFSRVKWHLMLRLSEKQQFIGKVQNKEVS